MRLFRVVGAAVAFAVGMLIGIAGCATPDGSPGPVPGPGVRIELGSPGDQIATYDGVRFYPACGNETLGFDGRLWFPFTPANPEDFPTPGAAADDAAATASGFTRSGAGSGQGTASTSVGMVIAPGPGDDVGTLTVYEGGFAYWVSDSGDVDTWLTTTKIEYNWVC
ncbi:MAG: hypothetical protein CVT68_00855 [Actinobacteria bacterium HGW-Actinobacteria-8]|nr:MAG: hypothetical protein CVT68_00855 [Actinobacteria bacterium HGW-Actinobacteria-8]